MRNWQTRIAFSLLALLLPACAVLTVDVDVYKGPLANEPNVQMQQMAVMATAAKPLLVQLRNRIEAPGNPEEVRFRHGYKNAYIDGRFFKSPYARQVNAILGLYEDRVPKVDFPADLPPSVADTYISLRLAIHSYERAQRRLDDREGPLREWRSMEPKRSELSRAYDIYFDRDPDEISRRKEQIFEEVARRSDDQELAAKLSEVSRSALSAASTLPSRSTCKVGKLRRCFGDNAMNRLLEDEDFVTPQAETLFPSDPMAQGAFVTLVTRTAGSFANARAAAEDVLTITLSLIPKIPRLRTLSPWERTESLEAAAAIAADLVQPQQLVLALSDRNANGDAPALLEELKERLPNVEFDSVISVGKDRRRVIATLSQLLVEKPDLAVDLLELNERFKALSVAQVPQCSESAREDSLHDDLCTKLSRPVAREFGITSGPFQINWGKMKGLFRRLRSDDPLEHGRLDEGLESLIENYLRGTQDKSSEACTDGDDCSELQLLEAMVYFSEKILFVVNNDVLLRQRREEAEGWIPWSQQVIKETLWRGKDSSIPTYTRLLQAVGNSIQVLANELQHAESRSRLNKGAGRDAELQAIAVAAEHSPGAYIDEILAALQSSEHKLVERLPIVVKQRTAEQERLIAISNAESLLADKRAMVQSAAANEEKLQKRLDAWNLLADDVVDEIFGEAGEGDAQDDEPPVEGDADEETAEDAAAAAAPAAPPAPAPAAPPAPAPVAPPPAPDPVAAAQPEAKDDAGTLAVDDIIERLKDALGTTVLPEEWAVLESELKTQLKDPPGARYTSKRLRKRINKSKTKIESDLAVTKTLKQKAQDAANTQEQQVGAKRAEPTPADSRSAAVKDAVTAIRDVRTSVEARLPARCSRQAVIVALRDALRSDKNASEILALLPAPPPPPPPPAQLPGKNSIEVIDSLLAELEHERIQVVAHLGEDSPAAQYLDQAIKRAYERRAGRIDLRPASAFLRTSFKTTALQDDASLGDKNLLVEHALKQLPFASYFKRRGADYETLQEIDKQFWQSVNRVRIAGAGDTNYVVAKDDVGNWYVKNMSADPEEIIRGAQALALAGAGPSMGANLLAMRGARDSAPDFSAAPKPLMQTQIEKFQTEYSDQTLADRDALKTALAGLKQRALDAMLRDANAKGMETDLTAALENAATKAFSADVFAESTDTTVVRKEILRGLRQIPSFYKQAVVEIVEKGLLNEATRARDTAKEEVEKVKKASEAAQTEATEAEEEFTESDDAVEELPGDATAPVVDAVKEQADEAKDDASAKETTANDRKEELTQAEAKLKTAEDALTARTAGLAYARRTLAETVGNELKQWVERRIVTASHLQNAMQILGDLGEAAATR